MDNKEVNNCSICFSPLVKYDMGEKNGYKFVSCEACGSVMTDPLLKKEDIDSFFAEVQPEIVDASNSEKIIGAFRKRIKKIVPNLSKKSFIDVSCRQGYAVKAAKELGFKKVKGIDKHGFFTSFCKNKYNPEDFENVTAQDYALKENMEQANVVFSIENFCEEPDLEGYVEALYKIIKPKGILYIQEVDGNNFLLPRKFTRWGYADPPLNFRYLSKKGLEALLKRHGFKIRKRIFTWNFFMHIIAVKK